MVIRPIQRRRHQSQLRPDRDDDFQRDLLQHQHRINHEEISLKRNYVATADFAVNHGDGADLRLPGAGLSARSKWIAKQKRRFNLYPCYYDSTPAHSVQTPLLDGTAAFTTSRQFC